ncbi:preprotein translocase subunit YajC [Chitinophaga skermanii]|uniref:Sec translocon accessory complex subunit YajC n=1 Tax=Chitinophaga skermanii TaxID=331697 RepID=A0A327QC91_9BACT|nr:preprotein translocase subunit YajC [Chitinophaga skermanii]RAJ02266.1 preprotein translocase subunit YajC [Chitinophaga skermanii]
MYINLLNATVLGQAQGGGFGGFGSLLFLGGMFLVMWLFMIRPQTKKAKEQKQFIDNLQEGDKIVTIAGIHGKIKKINPENNTLTIEVSTGTYLTIERVAISKEYSATVNAAATAEKK